MLADQDGGADMLEAELLAELDTTDLRLEADQVGARATTVAEAIEKLIATNARVPQNQADYQQRFDKLSAEHTALLEQHETLLEEITDRQNRVAAYEHYKREVSDLDARRIELTPYLWHTLTARAEVAVGGEIAFVFIDGSSCSSSRSGAASRPRR